MRIETDPFYYFSTEGFSPELPVIAYFVKKLDTGKNREAILIRCSQKIISYKTDTLVLVPKDIRDSFFNLGNTAQIFSYVIHGSKYKNNDTIDFKKISKMILDWGGVSFSLDIADKWQVKETDE